MEFRKIIDVEYREYDRVILEKSSEWLSDPEIKRLTFAPDLTNESQEKWFQSLKERTDYYICGVWRNDNPIGVVGLKNITDTDAEVFGYIGEKKYWGKAVGVDMMQVMLDKGRSLGLSSIYAKIRIDNLSSYKLHQRFGYKKEFEDDFSFTLRKNL
ncbi:MAG: GNAT family N-acetyltransferase [Fermentimonas sp.]|nr:GNAT family N-acetyltransferase [Fermentimonas sp.]